MPLTAYSASREMELDVDQLLEHLAQQTQSPIPAKSASISDHWKATIWSDIECPSCFCRGAEVVRTSNSRTTGLAVRQAYFRFPKSEAGEGHHPFCDFAGSVPAAHIPENLVQFSTAKDGVSRAVRELVCRGIQMGLLGQRDIRSMREWFFKTKVASTFVVTLDPRVPKWIASIQEMRLWPAELPSEELLLTRELLEIPGFDIRRAAQVAVTRQYKTLLDALFERRVSRLAVGAIEDLVNEYQGKTVFDPSSLQEEYQRAQTMVRFIGSHYSPVARLVSKRVPGVLAKGAKPLLAFVSLLLFISAWDLNKAMSLFARIASDTSDVDLSLGNLMGLNPFHDFEAWSTLKFLQALPPFDSGLLERHEDLDAWISHIKESVGL